MFVSRWRRLHRSGTSGKLSRAGVHTVCCTSSCRRTHFSSSRSVCRISFCGGVYIYSASGTSSFRRTHFSSSGKLRRASPYSAATALVVEYFSPGPAVCAAPATVGEYIAQAPAASYVAPAPTVLR